MGNRETGRQNAPRCKRRKNHLVLLDLCNLNSTGRCWWASQMPTPVASISSSRIRGFLPTKKKAHFMACFLPTPEPWNTHHDSFWINRSSTFSPPEIYPQSVGKQAKERQRPAGDVFFPEIPENFVLFVCWHVFNTPKNQRKLKNTKCQVAQCLDNTHTKITSKGLNQVMCTSQFVDFYSVTTFSLRWQKWKIDSLKASVMLQCFRGLCFRYSQLQQSSWTEIILTLSALEVSRFACQLLMYMGIQNQSDSKRYGGLSVEICPIDLLNRSFITY